MTADEAARALLEELDRPRMSQLRFNFTGASWKDVLAWLAEEGDMSLQVDHYPEGSVSFIDRNRTYTVAESMDLLNRLLARSRLCLDPTWANAVSGRPRSGQR